MHNVLLNSIGHIVQCVGVYYATKQTHPWVASLETSHFKFLKPIQFQNNIGLISRKLFILNFVSKDDPNHVKFETSIRFTKI
jgi:hypothetical protein